MDVWLQVKEDGQNGCTVRIALFRYTLIDFRKRILHERGAGTFVGLIELSGFALWVVPAASEMTRASPAMASSTDGRTCQIHRCEGHVGCFIAAENIPIFIVQA